MRSAVVAILDGDGVRLKAQCGRGSACRPGSGMASHGLPRSAFLMRLDGNGWGVRGICFFRRQGDADELPALACHTATLVPEMR